MSQDTRATRAAAPDRLEVVTTPDAAPSGAGGTAVGTIDAPRPGRWVDEWNPEDHVQWEGGGRAMARRNLGPSIFAEFLGFSVWQLWTVAAPVMVAAGVVTADQGFWLIAIPNLVGATLRLPYTFAVPRFGGRNWTIVSALLLLVPCAGLVFVAATPGIPFWVMLLVAATAGVGGGNFASSMANISFFYPEKEKGAALGLNAAGGNLGVAVIQAAAPFMIVAGAAATVARPAYWIIPLTLLSAVLAWKVMHNLSAASSDFSGYAAAARDKHTWVVSFLYIGTFGSFIGYAGAFPLLLTTQFEMTNLKLAFLGALVGSVARPFGGMVADRLGGARVSIGAYAVMAVGAVGAIAAITQDSLVLFFVSFIVLFTASGMGNGSTYRMIPVIFRRRLTAADGAAFTAAKRRAAACIGIAACIGAYGGFFIPRGFATSTAQFGSLVPALAIFVGFYLVCAVVTWAVYGRKGALGLSERI